MADAAMLGEKRAEVTKSEVGVQKREKGTEEAPSSRDAGERKQEVGA